MIPRLAVETAAPGSNVRDRGGGHSWVLWLPDLTVARAVALGDVPADVVAHLSRSAGRFDDVPDGQSVALDDGPIDLLVLTRSALRRIARHTRRADALRRALAPEATVAVIGRRAASRGPRRQVARLVGRPGVRARPAVLAPPNPRSTRSNGARWGLAVPRLRPHGALPRPARMARSASQLLWARLRRVVRAPRLAPSTRAHASDLMLLQPRRGRVPPRAALVVTPPASALSSPPAWIRRLLASAGLAEDRALSAFAAPRGYRSQKTLFLLGRTADQSPDLVVKVTQEPRFNHRLDAEAAALARLAEDRLVPSGTVPEVVHAGRYGGLSVAIETMCEGVPFRQVSTARPDCPLAERALEWLTSLATRTAQPDTRPRAERRAEAEQLVSRFIDTFAPPVDHREALYHRAAILADEEVPTVFFHGDPGPWNLLARPDGSIAVLDWENATPAGPPVWDLMLFLRGFGAFAAEARGERYTATAFVEQFRPDSDLRPLLDRSLADYGRRVGVGPAATESLIVLGWLHQALKEVSRLRPRSAASSAHRAAVAHLLDDPSLDLVPETA